jgi:TldD protein
MVAFEEQVDRLAEGASFVLRLALRRGGTFAEVFVEQSVRHQGRIVWDDGRLRNPPEVTRHAFSGASVRVLDGAEAGFAIADAITPTALRTAAGEAVAQLPGGGAARSVPTLTQRLLHLDVPADAPDTAAASEKTALLRAAAGAARLFDDRVQRVEAAYQDHVRRVAIATSDGVLAARAQVLVGLRIQVTLAGLDGLATAYAVAGGPRGLGLFFDVPPEHVARNAVERARRRTEARPLLAGTMPVVLAAGWGGVWLHEAVGHALEADVSSHAQRLGEKVAPSFVTLVDDPTHPGGRGTQPVDDEGNPTRPTTLIADGRLQALLTDRRHAARLGLSCTASARCQDAHHAPLPRMTNLILRSGDAAPGDLVAAVRDGLYVRAIGHGTARPDGTFAFDVLDGTRIEEGRLTHSVADVRIVGQGLATLQQIAGLGADDHLDAARGVCEKAGQAVPVSVGMPTVLLKDMQVLPV